ncbi:hypothetical protein DCCM_2367 [Desulfocucumis palustris]|uniref:Purine nucleoside phosphorylase n=2 Tax=Desulfocucumis palustris TaxID=1898651 RepID=A0A2L2XAR4_9FIRM|nr:hypothetical protein DCCM_2367 [Desulfocucumis palustris]
MAFHVGDRDEAVLENRRLMCRALGAEPGDMVAGKQVHGTEICRVTGRHRGKGARSLESAIPDTDGLVTAEPGILLSSYYADCVPVMLLDPVKKAVGLAHAGWKGTAGRIAAKAVQTLRECFGTDPGDCLAVVGPSIGPCCYEIDSPVLEQFKKSYENWPEMLRRTAPDRWKLNLWLANRRVLEEAGLKENNILEAGLCTACHRDLFFSYRGQSGLCGRMASLIMLK